PEAIEFESEKEFVQPQCPRCGSLNIALLGSNGALSLERVPVTPPLPVGSEGWVCAACGTCWTETEDPEVDGSVENT
ncbi:MAG: hypothetical protein WA414_09075, partial [Acidobacteriaceae bacterium]